MKKHPIELERLYTNPQKTGPFIIRAKALSAEIQATMTEEELLERQREEKEAERAEWAKIQRSS
jgi:hypothetical protein